MPTEMPSHFPQRVIAYLVDERQIPLPEIITAIGLPPEAMLRADALLQEELYPALVRFAIERTGDAAIGLGYGRSLQLSDLGLIGYAAGAQPTVAEGISLFARYYDGMSSLSRLAVEDEGGRYFLRVMLEPGLPDYMTWFLSEAIISAVLQNMARFNVPLGGVNAHFSYARPPHARRYEALDVTCYFSRDTTGITVPQQLLVLGLSEGGPVAQWPDALELVTGGGWHTLDQSALEGRLESIVRSSLPVIPSLESVAQRLGLSPRKLQRQLEQYGLQFRTLVGDIRVREASVRLQRAELTVREVAEQTGFADSASFTRAFKRVFDVTPGQYRKTSSPIDKV